MPILQDYYEKYQAGNITLCVITTGRDMMSSQLYNTSLAIITVTKGNITGLDIFFSQITVVFVPAMLPELLFEAVKYDMYDVDGGELPYFITALLATFGACFSLPQ